MNEKIAQLGKILDNSTYAAVLCGSGMMEEGGSIGIKKQDEAYDIESWYSYDVEEIHTSVLYNIRPGWFFGLYRKGMLRSVPRGTASSPALAVMERAGEFQCVIDSSIYDRAFRGGCYYIINLHGSIYQNQCSRCKKKYLIGYIAGAKRTPTCRDCNVSIQSTISLIGKMVDSQDIIRITKEVMKTDTLLLLGTTLVSEVFCQYIQYPAGWSTIIIHKQGYYLDKGVDLMILDHSMNVLSQPGYGGEETEEQAYFPFDSLTLF